MQIVKDFLAEIKRRWIRTIRSLYKGFRRLVAPQHKNSLRSLFRLFQAALAAVVLVLIVNLSTWKGRSFGDWGDFFGGTLNPLLTFLTFMWLLITIIIQQSELRESRVELRRSALALREQSNTLKRQSFESAYFQMIRTLNEIVQAIDLVDAEGRTFKGRDCFKTFYSRLNKKYRAAVEKRVPGRSDEECLRFAFSRFWNKHQSELFHYFRYLTAILDYIESESEFDGLYLENLEALLSDQELLLIFYFCVCEERFGSKLLSQVEQKGMLQNMPLVKALNRDHIKFVGPEAFAH